MSQAVVTAKINPFPSGVDNTQRHIVLFGTLSIGAGTYVTGGLPVSFINPATDSSAGPLWVEIASTQGSTNAYSYQTTGFSPPLSPPLAGNTGTLHIFVAGTELTNGATVPAGATSDILAFRAEFNKGF
jgi:hypothetical protein